MKSNINIAQQSNYFENVSPLEEIGKLVEKIGDSKVVLLGEATHGTHEYYLWRTEISKMLIEKKGFSFIAVEGDWPDCYKINRFVKGYDKEHLKVTDVLKQFRRWPTWMWANWEVAALAEWLKLHNLHLQNEKKVGFYGLDVYSLWESLDEMMQYLKKEDPETAQKVKSAIQCFEPFNKEGQDYAYSLFRDSVSCTREVLDLLKQVRLNAPIYDHDKEAPLNMEQNAEIAANAEKYYRAMMGFGPRSWNVRDIHMTETLNRLMKFHGNKAKAIVWEHNTHVGDARATDMVHEGLVNVGQLVRQEYDKDEVYVIGFSSYTGSVIASSSWGSPMQEMEVPNAKPGSLEKYLHDKYSGNNKVLIFKEEKDTVFEKQLPHRAIGVVYHPLAERGNYVPSIMPQRYDALIFLDSTRGVHPLHLHPNGELTPETYPFGV